LNLSARKNIEISAVDQNIKANDTEFWPKIS